MLENSLEDGKQLDEVPITIITDFVLHIRQYLIKPYHGHNIYWHMFNNSLTCKQNVVENMLANPPEKESAVILSLLTFYRAVIKEGVAIALFFL